MPKFNVSIKPDNFRGFSKLARIIERNGRHVLELFELRNLRCESGRIADHFKLMGRRQDSWKYWVYLPETFTWEDKETLGEICFTFDPESIREGWFREDWNARRNYRKWYCFFVLPAQVEVISRAQAQEVATKRQAEISAKIETARQKAFDELLARVNALTQELADAEEVTPVVYRGCGLLEQARTGYVSKGTFDFQTVEIPPRAGVYNEVRETRTGCYLFLSHSAKALYVGSSNNLGYRYRTHRDGGGCLRINELMRQGHEFSVLCLPVYDRETAYDLEQEYLDAFCRSEFFLNKNPDARSQEARRVRKNYVALNL